MKIWVMFLQPNKFMLKLKKDFWGISNGIIRGISASFAWLTMIILFAVFLFIARESWPVWSAFSPWEILTGVEWQPLSQPPQLQLGVMLASTLWVSLGALLLAIPLGFGGAIFLAEFAPNWLAAVIRPVLNILTGLPSVVYGFLGAAVLVKFFQVRFDQASGESLFCASMVLAIMILPYLVANADHALRAVPGEYRETGLALGVSRPYLALRVLLPLARKGLLGALILAFGRAAGETMAVLMLAGNTLVLPASWFSKGQPLPALIALELGSAEVGSIHYQGLFAAGLVLLVLVTGVNLSLQLIRTGRGNGN